jgi:hypothetical protein
LQPYEYDTSDRSGDDDFDNQQHRYRRDCPGELPLPREFLDRDFVDCDSIAGLVIFPAASTACSLPEMWRSDAVSVFSTEGRGERDLLLRL